MEPVLFRLLLPKEAHGLCAQGPRSVGDLGEATAGCGCLVLGFGIGGWGL